MAVALLAVAVGFGVEIAIPDSGLFGAFGGWYRVPLGLGDFLVGIALYRRGLCPRACWLTDNRVALWLGDISYPLYLAHLLPGLWLFGGTPAALWQTVGCILAAFAIAVVLHHAVEVPGRRLIRGGLRSRLDLSGRAHFNPENPPPYRDKASDHVPVMIDLAG